MLGAVKKTKINMGTFDLVKGLSMILIVLDHMLSHYDLADFLPDNAVLWVLAFLIRLIGVGINPVFFVIRGYMFKEKPAGKMLKKSFLACIRPYIYMMLAVAVLYPAVHSIQYGFGTAAFQQAARWVLAFLFGLHDPAAKQKVIFGIEVRACWVAWFLLTMFLSSNIFNLILKVKNKAAQTALAMLSVVTGYVLSLTGFTYFCLPQGLIAVGYYWAGYMLRKTDFFERKRSVQIGISLIFLVVTAWEAIYGNCSLPYNQYKYGLLEFVGTCCAGSLLLILSLRLGQWEWKGLDWMKQIGIYAFWIMCVHSVELICLPWNKIVKAMPEYPLLAFAIEIALKVLIFAVSCTVLKSISQRKYQRMRARKCS